MLLTPNKKCERRRIVVISFLAPLLIASISTKLQTILKNVENKELVTLKFNVQDGN